MWTYTKRKRKLPEALKCNMESEITEMLRPTNVVRLLIGVRVTRLHQPQHRT